MSDHNEPVVYGVHETSNVLMEVEDVAVPAESGGWRGLTIRIDSAMYYNSKYNYLVLITLLDQGKSDFAILSTDLWYVPSILRATVIKKNPLKNCQKDYNKRLKILL